MHGTEPQLAANLASFMQQDYAGPVQYLFGVQRGDDPAIAVVETLRRQWHSRDIALVLDARAHGTNAKVCNLINLQEHVQHDVVVISDSDMVVDPDYIGHLIAVLDQPGIGAVSCLYRGRADAGIWSTLVAMGIDLHFLPSTLIGLGIGLAQPCMGSTIAMRTTTLAQIGGFHAVCDILADDYAIGEAVRALGLEVAVSRRLITHACAEPSLAALVRHELRWSATIAGIDPGGFAGSVVLHPLPFALISLAILGGHPWTWGPVMLAIGVRGAMLARLGGRPVAHLLFIPLRDTLSFGLFLATFFVRSVDWRGHRLTIHGGRIVANSEVHHQDA
nr:bacteriohopanetetrol glucosamine biosynthesis glycosyltransferase HpnI [Sphingomonas sp. BAUL-RG-20F-R05-02]